MADEFKRNIGQAGSPFDPYNFSEIEKIQQDIERDLHTYRPIELTETLEITDIVESPEVSSSVSEPVNLSYSTEHTEELTDSDIAPSYTLATVSDTSDSPEKFYTETIKQKPPTLNERLRPYRRLIIALLVICTLGTGTLGVGMGFGIAFLQHRTGMSDRGPGNNPEYGMIDQNISSTRIVFGSEGMDVAREGSLADVVKLVDPAVVSISTVFQNQLAHPFFGVDQLGYRGGSGIIFAKDDERIFIVTNQHVIQGAREVNVSIMEQEPVSARLVGRNIDANLAVISVPAADVQRLGIHEVVIAVFGDSDAMQVGDVVLAIGNAMGEGNSTTSGIISAGEKDVEYMGRTLRVLQTDAAINPGSSGGPLINKDGQVIGINKWLASTEHYAIEGMGFSIPSNVAKPIIEEIMNSTPRPFLGIQGQNVDEEFAAQIGIPPIGIYIESVIPGTSAERAGIIRGDIITSFNGRTVLNMEQLVEEIGRANVGDTVEILIIRGGRDQLTLQATLGENILDNF